MGSPGFIGTREPLLEWLPEETLFSLVSRLHRLWGHSVPGLTAEALFGHTRAGTQHDLPSHLAAFCGRTRGTYGCAEALAEDRTLLRFYRPFASRVVATEAVRRMSGTSVAHLKFKLGLLTSRFGASHPLKTCLSCHREGVEAHGWAYWRLEHQYPGVWVCARHGEPLLQLNVKTNGIERFSWQLPREERLQRPYRRLSSAAALSLTRLSGLTTALVHESRPDGWLNASGVWPILMARLDEMGALTPAGSLRMADLAPDFLRCVGPLREIPELAALPETLDEATSQIGRMLRPPRAGIHPLRLLVVIHWLFGDSVTFLGYVDGLHPPARPRIELPALEEADQAAEGGQQVLLRLVREGASARSAASQVDVDVNTALGWMSKAGISIQRRPKIMDVQLRRVVVAALRRGQDKAAVSKRSGLSITTVTRVLLSEPGLKERWDHVRLESRRQQARAEWTRALRLHPGLGIKLVRATAQAAYAWLYRHDREWLDAHSPQQVDQKGPRASAVRWDERDLRLSKAVEQAALAIASEHFGKGVRLQGLVQAVPSLKAKLRALDRLPLTRRALERALGRSLSRSRNALGLS